jgi:hypothetical protein
VRSSIVGHSIINQGFLVGFMQILFCLVVSNNPSPIFDGLLVLGYDTVFSKLPLVAFFLD